MHGRTLQSAPSDVDPDYPQYGTFFSDSIGVFGFDPTDNVNGIKDPAATTDFMGYSPDDSWISAYTYNALRGSNFGPTGGSQPAANQAHGRQGVLSETLFLGLSISRERKVTRRPSFHYPAPSHGRPGCCEFIAELQDQDHNTLICATLHPDCNHVGCHCWPKIIREAIPYPSEAKHLLVYEGEKCIYEEEIPVPPHVKIEGIDQAEDGVLLKWSVTGRQRNNHLWHIVQWYDEDFDTWRGVAPRQQDRELMLSREIFGKRSAMMLRVLTTSGIATDVAQTNAAFEAWRHIAPEISLRGVTNAVKAPVPIEAVIEAVVTDASGTQLDDSRAMWHGNGGAALTRGRKLDLRILPPGRHTIRFAVPLASGSFAASSWLVERTAEGFLMHQAIREPAPNSRAASCDCYDHEGH